MKKSEILQKTSRIYQTKMEIGNDSLHLLLKKLIYNFLRRIQW